VNMPESGPSDASLINAWVGDRREAAFHALVERYAGLVRAAALRTCADESLASEAAQLTFITLARRAKSLTKRESIAGWLHLTAVYQARNLLRQHRREAHKLERLRKQMNTHPPEAPSESWHRMQPVLDEAIASLPARDREALLLRFYRSLSIGEVADTLGIASDAARKRLDRATQRLRRQLARRGCRVGTSLSAAMLLGLGGNAKAATPGASALAANALAAGSSPGGALTLSTLGLLTMTHKTTAIAATAVLLAGLGTVAIVRSRTNPPEPRPDLAAAPSRAPADHAPADGWESNSRRVRSVPFPDLASTYGESRMNLSRHTANSVVGLLENATEMGEMIIQGRFGGPDALVSAALGQTGRGLELDESQRAEASRLLSDYQHRQLERSRRVLAELQRDPSPLMSIMLAGDAYRRGTINEDAYLRAQGEVAPQLEGVLNPLDPRSFHGGNPLLDEGFRTGLEAVLDERQLAVLEAAVAESGESKTHSGMADLPPTELEQLSEMIETTSGLVDGHRQMMEGIDSLEGMRPEAMKAR